MAFACKDTIGLGTWEEIGQAAAGLLTTAASTYIKITEAQKSADIEEKKLKAAQAAEAAAIKRANKLQQLQAAQGQTATGAGMFGSISPMWLLAGMMGVGTILFLTLGKRR